MSTISRDEYVILPAGDMLAFCTSRGMGVGRDDKVDLSIERVLAIAVPIDTSAYLAKYFVEGHGWIESITDEPWTSCVRELAAPDRINGVVRDYMEAHGEDEIGDCSCMEPWIDYEAVFPLS